VALVRSDKHLGNVARRGQRVEDVRSELLCRDASRAEQVHPGLEEVERLRPLVPRGSTGAQFALRWVIDQPQVSVVIPGARNGEQARGTRRWPIPRR
jgi:aryl-alcohol dehydrogenase-like predicted oxidoreductase